MTWVRRFEPLFGASWFTTGPLLVLAPHPDDEVLGAGGLIAAHRAAGRPVEVVVMTDGGLGDAGRAPAAGYAEARRDETRRALDAIGGAGVTFLDVPDGALVGRPDAADQVAAVIRRVLPATIAFPSPLEVHPDHRATALWAARAIGATGHRGRILAYEIGAFMPTNVLLDVTRLWDAKERAVRCYASQLVHHDLVAKVRALARARTVNVDDRSIEYVEAFTLIDPGSLDAYMARAEDLARVIDAMGPVAP